jgi:hypothetical protein
MGARRREIAGLWAALLALSLLQPPAALAAPQAGERLPDLESTDVTGQPQHLHALLGPDRTLLVAITDRSEAAAMRAWFDAASARAPRSTARVSVISLGLPFFVSEGQARGKARAEVPQAYWHASLLDTHHQMAKRLGLRSSSGPFAFAVAADGQILAAVNGPASSPDAGAIWRALSG